MYVRVQPTFPVDCCVHTHNLIMYPCLYLRICTEVQSCTHNVIMHMISIFECICVYKSHVVSIYSFVKFCVFSRESQVVGRKFQNKMTWLLLHFVIAWCYIPTYIYHRLPCGEQGNDHKNIKRIFLKICFYAWMRECLRAVEYKSSKCYKLECPKIPCPIALCVQFFL